MSRLGRLAPTDWEHVEKWPLQLAALPDRPVPVVLGIDWYGRFDLPSWQPAATRSASGVTASRRLAGRSRWPRHLREVRC